MKFILAILFAFFITTTASAAKAYRCLLQNEGRTQDLIVNIDLSKGLLSFYPDSFKAKFEILSHFTYRPSPLYKDFTAFRATYSLGITQTIYVEDTLLGPRISDQYKRMGRISFGGWEPADSDIVCE